MKKVLVTGANGFIGKHTLKTLTERGFEVHAVASKKLVSNKDNFAWHVADLFDYEQTARLLQKVQPTHLLHFAWDTTPGQYWTSSNNFIWLQASLELIQQFRNFGGQRIVAAGSCAEYDWGYGYCSESITPTNPITPYGICKKALQDLLKSYSIKNGLSYAWGRIFFLYGPHELPERLVPSVIRPMLRGEPARCTHGGQIRDFLHVQDVAEAFVALLESNVNGPVNIASGEPIMLKDIIYKIADRFNRKDLIQLGSIQTPLNEPKLLVADVKRLNHEVGWVPKISLDQGLDMTISWWKGRFSKNGK